MRRSPFALLAVTALTLAACGDETTESSSSEKTSGSTSAARREAASTRQAITRALATYRAGDAKQAENQVSEAYVSHFEKVEGPLEKQDEALNESLEERISRDLRAAVKAGDDAEVSALGKRIVTDLQKAEAALR
jgi:hypothetical protein